MHDPAAAALPGHGALGRAKVTLTEPLGAITVVWLEAAGQRMGVQLAPDTDPPVNSDVMLLADTARVSLFDKASELRL